MKLPYKRFVRQVSTGAPRPKSTYLALMAENAEALKTAEWREATPLDAALVPHDFTRESFLSDEYDAFKMTGAFSTSTQAETAFAGMAAYRFKLPDAYTGSGATATITSLSLKVSRDRFCRKGLRIAYELNSVATPSTSWTTIRTAADLSPDGTAAEVLTQASAENPVPHLTASSAAETTLTIPISGAETGGRKSYLWVYISLEDYEDRWTMYNATEQRQYAIEGSGMVVGDSVDVAFNQSVAADSAAGARLVTVGWTAGNVRHGTNAKPDSSGLRTWYRAFAAGHGTNAPLYLQSEASLSPFAATPSSAAVSHIGLSLPNFGNDTDAANAWTAAHKEILDLLCTGHGVTDAVILGDDFYFSTKNGLYHGGTISSSDWMIAVDDARGKLDRPGGDLIVAVEGASVGDSPTWSVECVSFGGGVISAGDYTIPYDGEMTGIGHYNLASSGKFVVAGDLRSVNGVACSTYGVVSISPYGSVRPVFGPGDGQTAFAPNVYDNFRVVKAGDFYALGDFTSLGGVSRPYGIGRLYYNSTSQTYTAAAVSIVNSGSGSSEKYVTDIGCYCAVSSGNRNFYPTFIIGDRIAVPA